MPGPSENLRLNSNVQDPFFIGGASKFEYKHWGTVRNFYNFRRILPPKEVDNWVWSGVSITRQFEIEKLAEKVTRLRLEMNVGPLLVSNLPLTVGAGYLRFCDYLGYAMIEYVELRHATNVVQRLTGDQLWLRNVKYMNTEQRDAENVCVAGRLSTSQRDYAATQTQHLIVNLPFYFSDDERKALTMHSLSQEPKIFVKFRPLSTLLQTDQTVANVTAAVTGVQMSAECIALEPQERDDWTAMLQKKYGLVFKIDDYIQSNILVTTSVAQGMPTKLALDSHRGATKCVNVMVRRAAGSDGNTTSYARYYEDFAEIPAFKITSVGGHEITQNKDNLYVRFSEWPIYHPSPAAPQILFHSFTMNPADHNNCEGSMNFASITKPQLELAWADVTGQRSPAENYICTVITEEHSMVQHSNGELLNTITTN